MNGRNPDGCASGLPGDGPLGEDGGRGMLPLGMQTFRDVRGSGDYYVDKTAYALRMVSEGKCYFFVTAASFR